MVYKGNKKQKEERIQGERLTKAKLSLHDVRVELGKRQNNRSLFGNKKKGLIVSLQRDIHTRDKTIREMYDGS